MQYPLQNDCSWSDSEQIKRGECIVKGKLTEISDEDDGVELLKSN